jgi:hypothetical protein
VPNTVYVNVYIGLNIIGDGTDKLFMIIMNACLQDRYVSMTINFNIIMNRHCRKLFLMEPSCEYEYIEKALAESQQGMVFLLDSFLGLNNRST